MNNITTAYQIVNYNAEFSLKPVVDDYNFGSWDIVNLQKVKNTEIVELKKQVATANYLFHLTPTCTGSASSNVTLRKVSRFEANAEEEIIESLYPKANYLILRLVDKISKQQMCTFNGILEGDNKDEDNRIVTQIINTIHKNPNFSTILGSFSSNKNSDIDGAYTPYTTFKQQKYKKHHFIQKNLRINSALLSNYNVPPSYHSILAIVYAVPQVQNPDAGPTPNTPYNGGEPLHNKPLEPGIPVYNSVKPDPVNPFNPALLGKAAEALPTRKSHRKWTFLNIITTPFRAFVYIIKQIYLKIRTLFASNIEKV